MRTRSSSSRGRRTRPAPCDLEQIGRFEAHRELVAMLDAKPLSGVPPELFADHLVAGYRTATWPVLCDAGLALLWRFAAARRAEPAVVERPAFGAWRGGYRVRQSDGAELQVVVWGLSPLLVSCSCANYLEGSLGLCEHGAAVCLDLAQHPQVIARAMLGRPRCTPSAWWDPIRPLRGEAHWLEGVRVRPDVVSAEHHRWLEPVAEAEGAEPTWLRFSESAVDAAPRRELLQALQQWCEADGLRDPALEELIDQERDTLRRAEALGAVALRLDALLEDFALSLYPHQQHAIRRFLGSGRMLLADDMGLGKTIQATAIGHALVGSGLVRRVLVLAPASLKGQWVREWRRASRVPIESLDGPPPVRRRLLDTTTRGVIVANYELMLRDSEWFQDWSPELVILDEAQRVKNPATQTARRIKALTPPYRLALTGTPIENRLRELASILEWIDPRALAPLWQLSRPPSAVYDRAFGLPHVRTLRARIEPLVLRRTRREVLPDLPPRHDQAHTVPMTPAQRGAHDELIQPIAILAKIADRRPLTRGEFLRLMTLLNSQRMHANGLGQSRFEALWPRVRDLDPGPEIRAALQMPKLEVWRSLVESIVVQQGHKLVLFSQWRRTLQLARWAIADLLARAGLRAEFFTGQESPKRRTHNVVDFHDEPAVRVLLCTDAGGVGLNLQRAASHCVQFELPWNPAVFEQRVARLHRLGQPNPVEVHTLMSTGSIEQRISQLLVAKRSLFDDVFGDTDRAGNQAPTSFLARVRALVDTKAA